ncbi:MAG: cysteine desulfurase [Bacillota bacterium]|nr:cysteine desulfurase [Bacillota bacterium]
MDARRIRQDFPILRRRVHDRPLVYLDSAATSQKPEAVLAAVDRYYREMNANVHRAIHTLGEEATEAYERARARVARFIGAGDPRGLIFVRNTTEAINLVAQGWARQNLKPGDEILLTEMEHHSNLVPWQLVARETGASLVYARLTPDGELDWADFKAKLGRRTRLVTVTHVSNVLGTVNPVEAICREAHRVGARALVDGAQSVPHMPVDVGAIDCDFLAFSGHKMLGPMGIGALWARPEILEETEPLFGGGEMIAEVFPDHSTWNELPWKFEAGTPDVAGAIGLEAAVEYLEGLGMENVAAHERELTRYAYERLERIEGLRIYGPRPPEKEHAGVVTFNLLSVHPHDLSMVLDRRGVAVRAGHHCAQPLMRWLDVPSTARASFYIYTLPEEIDVLAEALEEAREYFSHVLLG